MTQAGTDLRTAARLLRDGELVAFGTETVYGLGADATNNAAVAAIFAAKERPMFDPLIVHVPDESAAKDVAKTWTPLAEAFAESFWPGPLTLVVPKKDVVGDLVTSGLPSVGLRVPELAKTRDLLQAAGCPVAAPSANRFGSVSPTNAQHVLDQLDGRLAYVFDTGPSRVGVESTVVRINGDEAILLRPGGVSLEQLRAVAPEIRIAADTERGELQSPDSPGQLPQHYAPGIPLRLGRPPIGAATDGLLQFGPPPAVWNGPIEVLSASGDCNEAATNLFAAMRRLAPRGATRIFADRIPETGLGRAINDRLARAAAS